jgi:hypothetical protein
MVRCLPPSDSQETPKLFETQLFESSRSRPIYTANSKVEQTTSFHEKRNSPIASILLYFPSLFIGLENNNPLKPHSQIQTHAGGISPPVGAKTFRFSRFQVRNTRKKKRMGIKRTGIYQKRIRSPGKVGIN